MDFSPFPVLVTKRLILRQLNDSDDLSIYSLRSDENVNKCIERPILSSIREAKKFIEKINSGINQGQWVYWALCQKDQPDLIGTICLWNFSVDKTIAEVGYEQKPDFQGHGFMNEALQCILAYGFGTIGLIKIEAYTHIDNLNSTRLLERNHFLFDPKRKDEKNPYNIIYSLTRQEYITNASKGNPRSFGEG